MKVVGGPLSKQSTSKNEKGIIIRWSLSHLEYPKIIYVILLTCPQ